MAYINKIKPGQTLYDVRRNTGIQVFNGKYSVWPVLVESVHLDEGYIVARWNVVNKPERMYLSKIKSLRIKEPKQ